MRRVLINGALSLGCLTACEGSGDIAESEAPTGAESVGSSLPTQNAPQTSVQRTSAADVPNVSTAISTVSTSSGPTTEIMGPPVTSGSGLPMVNTGSSSEEPADIPTAASPSDTGGSGKGETMNDTSGSAPDASAWQEDIPCDREFDIPTFAELTNNPKLPDPFAFLDGSRVNSKEDFVCRQKEINLLAQAFIYGPKPPPPETLSATFQGGTLKVEMSEGGRNWTLSVNITTPSGAGPFPAVFNVDGSGTPAGMASIGTSLSWLTTNVASAPMYSRDGGGKFYDFHPNSSDTGSLMAWAWAASRILDGLVLTRDAHNIDVTKTFGLGCSRNGKTAATMALFDRRMVMAAMYSPGSGTTSGWRIAEAQTSSVQTASQIYGETTWMGEPFGQFGNQVDKLPIDQHEVLALAWPRPLLVREGTNDTWNCPVCVYTTVKYTQMIYDALGAGDRVGFTHYNGGHCESGGNAWSSTFNAFVAKYIQDDTSVSTNGLFTESFTFDAARWQDGELPALP